MASLTNLLAEDPTLAAADKALEEKAAQEKPRPYLGMSGIGEACGRKSWYRFRHAKHEIFDADTLKRFEDGHRTEALVIERLKLLKSLTVIDVDPVTNYQIGFTDCDGHFRGHADGSIIGLMQAPKALHVLEVKCCSEKKINELKKAITDCGEKAALRKWNPTYYAQGMLYCHYMNATRHYLVVASPGGRTWMGVRTNSDIAHALSLIGKAKRVIASQEPLDRVSNKPDWFECRFCAFSGICHEGDEADRNCRTCVHSSVIDQGRWRCERWDKELTHEDQLAGCAVHIYLPKLVPGEVIATTEISITYKFKDGSTWTDAEVK